MASFPFNTVANQQVAMTTNQQQVPVGLRPQNPQQVISPNQNQVQSGIPVQNKSAPNIPNNPALLRHATPQQPPIQVAMKTPVPVQRCLLVKEQPLPVQELLDQEKKEQERARQKKLNQG